MTGPLGNSEFCFPRISMFPETKSMEIRGKQNSLFPSGPVIKCLLPDTMGYGEQDRLTNI